MREYTIINEKTSTRYDSSNDIEMNGPMMINPDILRMQSMIMMDGSLLGRHILYGIFEPIDTLLLITKYTPQGRYRLV